MADQISPKKIRKGTRSCQECRRRKKHCIWPAENPSACNECSARSVPCHKQHVSTSKRSQPSAARNLQDRVAQLENILQSLGSANASISASESPHSEQPSQQQAQYVPATPSSSSGTTPQTRLDNAPIVSFFDNSILCRQADETCLYKDAPNAAEISAHAAVINEKKRLLLAEFPSPALQKAILDAERYTWQAWSTTYPPLFGLTDTFDIKQMIADCKNGPTVAHVAKALLCMNISLQEAPDIALHCPEQLQSRREMIMRQQKVLNDVLFSDDELCTSIEGVECYLLQTSYDLSLGRVRKAWLDSRKAVALAQLCGFQRIARPTPNDDMETRRKRAAWKCLYSIDHWESLIAGLPCCISESVANGWSTISDDPPECEYFVGLTNIVGHIVDRNQQPPSHRTLSKTIHIEGELMDLASTKPDTWWTLQPIGPISMKDLAHRLIPQFWHHQARLLLHLPYMLKANTDRRYEYNRVATLESARAMIHLFRRLRPAQGGPHLCKVIDFQAFTAAMALVLNHFGNNNNNNSYANEDTAESDHELLRAATEVMQQGTTESDETVAKEATRALDIFNKSWDGAALATQGPSKVFVPYYGPVVFGPGQDFARQQQQQHPRPPSVQGTYPTPPCEQLDITGGQNSNCSISPGLNPTPTSSTTTTANQFSDTNLFESTTTTSTEQTFGAPQQSVDNWGWADPFANINMDLMEDWSWFWDNTQIGQAVNV